jgi:peptidoglycan/LPS O-acetylase OafA/YrhL
VGAAMSTPPASRLAYVDSLRFAAALLVLFQHIGERFESGIVKWAIGFGPGLSGVILFFLISGFVIPFSVRMPFDPITYMFAACFVSILC